MDATRIGALVGPAWNDIKREWARLATLQKRIEGKLLRTWMPDDADLEYKDLFRKASSPWLGFARDAIGQGCRIDGYSDDVTWYGAWQSSGMDGRQGAVTREAIGLGYTYGATLPTDDPDRVLMRPMSSLKTYAHFDDPYDEHPAWVLHLVSGSLAKPSAQRWMFIDETHVARFQGDPRTPRELEAYAHEMPWCPVRRIGNTLPVDGLPQSSVEAAITVYQRIVDATFTLQMVQRYGAFPQKWMAGGQIAVDANGKPLLRSSIDGLIHADGESGETARFGTFAPADLDQVVAALDAHIKHFSALVQVPPHYLLGAIVNMSAEGIAAAESGYFRNVHDRQDALGEGYEAWLRDAAEMLGSPAADDVATEIHWADESSRSVAQVADAISKLSADGVDAPLELLFAMVPGWTKADAREAAERAEQRRMLREMQQRALEQGPTGPLSARFDPLDEPQTPPA